MCLIDDKSVDVILCDLPYGTVGVKTISWDKVLPLDKIWQHYERIIKDNGAIILTASQPFTTDLINSNRKLFKYEWIWNKGQAGNFANAKKQPLRKHENILIFYKKPPTYNPQMELAEPKNIRPTKDAGINSMTTNKLTAKHSKEYKQEVNYPSTIIYFHGRMAECNSKYRIHPTQKPVALFEYLIKTYSNEGDLVLDNCMGSGTTAIACINTNRNYIGFETDKTYYDLANKRINQLTIKNT